MKSNFNVFVILLVAALTGCSEPVRPPFKPTELQKEYLKTAPLNVRVYMESCISTRSPYNPDTIAWRYCQEDAERILMRAGAAAAAGPSVGKIAVGAAIGYGAAKVLLKK